MTQGKGSRVVRRFDAAPTASLALELVRELSAVAPYEIAPIEPKPLFLYGAGNLGRLALDYCQNVGLKVEGVIDREAARHRQSPIWAGVNVISPDEATDSMKTTGRLAVSIVTIPWNDLATSLAADGWCDILPFYTLCISYRDLHPLDNGWLTGPLTEEDKNGMASVLSRYADDVSRAHHLQFAAWHAIQQEWIFADAPVIIENRYFIPEVTSRLHDHESFVDLGAYHGDVFLRFLQIVNGEFESILAVEPDQHSMTYLRARLAAQPAAIREKVVVDENVLGEREKAAQFRDGLGFASRLVERGGFPVRVRTLDSFKTAPSFMKLHLEGSELDVLLGSLQTIREHRPIIALTVYHDRMGLWPTAKRLMDELIDCGYRFYFRLHGWSGTGALVYLIPESR